MMGGASFRLEKMMHLDLEGERSNPLYLRKKECKKDKKKHMDSWVKERSTLLEKRMSSAYCKMSE